MKRGWRRFYAWLYANCPIDPPDCYEESLAILEDLIASGVEPSDELFEHFKEIMPSVWLGMKLADKILAGDGG